MADITDMPNERALPVLLQFSEQAAISEGREQFLRLRIASEMRGLLSIRNLSEVLTVRSHQIVPIPHMRPWVMGVYNWRGEILWMVDLGHLFGLTPWYQQAKSLSSFTAVVLHGRFPNASSPQMNDRSIGLVVHQAEDIEWLNPNLIQDPHPSAVKPEMATFLKGYWLTGEEDMLAVLDGDAILATVSQP